MPKNNFSKLLNIFPQIFDEENVISNTTLNTIKKVVKIDNAKIYMLSPNLVEEIYPNQESIKISDKLSRDLFNEETTEIKEFSKANHIITHLKIKGIIFGFIIFEKDTFSEEEESILKTIAQIISYKIKDEELNEVFKTQLKLISKALNKAKTAEKIKTDFVANISHELRTPLNAILGFSDLLKNKKVGILNQRQNEYVSEIQTSSLHLLEMINEILDISKIENSAIELAKQTFDITMAINEVVGILYPLIENKNIKLIQKLESTEIKADYQKIKQILFNIINNAIKFTKDRIEITTLEQDKLIEISIKDNGIGIEKKNHKKIFKKFTQINDYSTKKESSTGLGLTISKEFIKLHKGKILVNSEKGNGAEFIITIPKN